MFKQFNIDAFRKIQLHLCSGCKKLRLCQPHFYLELYEEQDFLIRCDFRAPLKIGAKVDQ